MTEERLNEIKRQFHQAIIDNALKEIKYYEEIESYATERALPMHYVFEDVDIKIAKCDERIRKSMMVLESIKNV